MYEFSSDVTVFHQRIVPSTLAPNPVQPYQPHDHRSTNKIATGVKNNELYFS